MVINMILIIGGASQGKYEYAKNHFPETEIINKHHEIVRTRLQAGETMDQIVDSYEKAEVAVQMLLEEKTLAQNTSEHSVIKDTEVIVISDEVGYGVVPMDAFERQYRDAVGKVNQILAGRAKQVIRVVAGIGVRIK